MSGQEQVPPAAADHKAFNGQPFVFVRLTGWRRMLRQFVHLAILVVFLAGTALSLAGVWGFIDKKDVIEKAAQSAGIMFIGGGVTVGALMVTAAIEHQA
jgi:hypothetical protein